MNGLYYGSDASGLVWGYLFDRADGSAHALDSSGAAAWMAKPEGAGRAIHLAAL